MNRLDNIQKHIGIQQNVTLRVIDEATNTVVSEHVGHNAATNTLFTGIGHYLMGETILNQGDTLRNYVPQYISLGTMGLLNQDQDDQGLPAGLGPVAGSESARFTAYMETCPGYGSDGYDASLMNNRPYAGLGPIYADRPSGETANCELISTTFPRSKITYREYVPEHSAEIPKTVDIIFSALISTGALAQFREPDKDYIFITEAGLWSGPTWKGTGDNTMLAGYRIIPPDEANWDMSIAANREILKQNILKVKVNQVVQVVWKIQLGAIEQFR